MSGALTELEIVATGRPRLVQSLRELWSFRAGMRYFFHIVDKYGLSPDGIGCELADQDAAILHARRIAAELAKAGEFFRFSVVFVALIAVPGASSNRNQSMAGPVAAT